MIRWNARKAGRSGAKVSRICLGTMNFGAVTSEPDAHAIMGSAHSRGINFFDWSSQHRPGPGQLHHRLATARG